MILNVLVLTRIHYLKKKEIFFKYTECNFDHEKLLIKKPGNIWINTRSQKKESKVFNLGMIKEVKKHLFINTSITIDLIKSIYKILVKEQGLD